MSAHGRRLRRLPSPVDRAPSPNVPEPSSAWLAHALSTEPADRPAAEAAITGLYHLIGEPAPAFAWVDSPAAALDLLPPSARDPVLVPPLPLEGRLANEVVALRARLDRRISREHHPSWTDGALHRVVRRSLAAVVHRELGDRVGVMWFGQHDVDWVAHYDVRRHRGARYDDEDTAHLGLWATLARSCGWWWPREGVCVVTERPAAVHLEQVPGESRADHRLHRDDGPAVSYRDGWSVHSWHGTRVPAWVIDHPTAALIATERNAEVRRCAVERLGWDRFLDQAGLTLVSTAPDPGNPGCDLSLYDLPYREWGAPSRLLVAVNGSVEHDGSRRRYGLRVPPWFDDPVDAAGWSYGLSGAHYALLQRRT